MLYMDVSCYFPYRIRSWASAHTTRTDGDAFVRLAFLRSELQIKNYYKAIIKKISYLLQIFASKYLPVKCPANTSQGP